VPFNLRESSVAVKKPWKTNQSPEQWFTKTRHTKLLTTAFERNAP
jgi:hypothetical protein